MVASLDHGPGNITVTPGGRIILSLHQFYEPGIRVAELMDDGTLKPFPTDEWAGSRGETAVLADPDLKPEERAVAVERYGDKPPSDGITMDAENNVYITDGGGNTIGVTRPDGTYEPLIVDRRIEWPDGLSNGPDGFIYGTVNRLNNTPQLNGGESTAVDAPYYIIRFRALGKTVPGR